MSRLARRKFNAETGMSDFKIMGTISDVTSKQLTQMVTTQDTSNGAEIINAIATILKSPVGSIKADLYVEPIEGKFQISTNYETENVLGAFYVISSGSMNIEIGRDTIKMQPNKIYFVNDRTTYRITKTDSINTSLLSGVFKWDKELHGS